MASEAESVEEENVFYFESDHLAVRGNRDYGNVLRTIAVLQAQRILVHKHLEELEIAKKRYMENPDLLLQKLRNKEEVIAPNYMTVVKLPEIGHYDTFPPEEQEVKQEVASNSEQTQVVRGRLFDESKPETFNQLWSCEEQRRLEELLVEYPVEAVEMRRFSKIAKALGNRTPQQVASRVQKYFKKLFDAGMPIPGRIPKNRQRGVQSRMKNLYRPTTFFPAHNVTVQMSEDDFQLTDMQNLSSPAGSKAYSSGSCGADNNDSTCASEKPEMKTRILYILEKIRDEKRLHCDGYNPDPLAAKCGNCLSAPISSTRWRCNTCYCYLNQCPDCIASQLLSHKFEHLTHDVIVEEEK